MLRRAFTLIELLLVIGIIALLAGILLPSLGGARKTAARTVGLSNLRSMGQLHAVHVGDHKGDFYNPIFDGMMDHIEWGAPGPSGEDPITFPCYANLRFTTEGFMAYWYSYMALVEPNSGLVNEAGVSPADGEHFAPTRAAAGSDARLTPNSFYYSPVFWKQTGLYDFHHMDCPCCCNEHDPVRFRQDQPCPGTPEVAVIARHNIAEVTTPSSKVILWERADFGQSVRAVVSERMGGTQSKSPAWNNPRARPYVNTVDGSVRQVDMTILTQKAAESRKVDQLLELFPTDLFEARDALPVVPLKPQRAPVMLDLPLPTDGLYPYFFAGTRYGVKGRDLP